MSEINYSPGKISSHSLKFVSLKVLNTINRYQEISGKIRGVGMGSISRIPLDLETLALDCKMCTRRIKPKSELYGV